MYKGLLNEETCKIFGIFVFGNEFTFKVLYRSPMKTPVTYLACIKRTSISLLFDFFSYLLLNVLLHIVTETSLKYF